jgi:hypothetical protein
MWVITYHWYTKFAVGGRPDQPMPTATCQEILAAAGRQNGLSLDGTPIIHSGEELHFLEGVASHPEFGLPLSEMPPTSAPCAQESNEDAGGADNGTVWLVCPTIPDPTRGGIAKDAFLDVVRRSDGSPLDPRITANFHCLQEAGQFCQTTTKNLGKQRAPAQPPELTCLSTAVLLRSQRKGGFCGDLEGGAKRELLVGKGRPTQNRPVA